MELNNIEKIILNHETIIQKSAKHVLIELVRLELEKDDKKIKYEKISKNYSEMNLESFIVHVILNVDNNSNIENKNKAILKNIVLFLDMIATNADNVKTNNNTVYNSYRPNSSDVKLISGRLIRTNDINNNVFKYTNVNNNRSIMNLTLTVEMKKILDLLLLDIWYVIEYINNNKLTIAFSSNIHKNNLYQINAIKNK
jgi:hypothetical protein